MSVYTTVERPELGAFLERYEIGELLSYEGISAGIENTNYFVTTSAGPNDGRYVLTIFESHSAGEMGYFLDLMAHLSEHGTPTAHPIPDRQGVYLQTLKGKPAALVQRLQGRSLEHPDADHCATMGAELARFHRAGQSFGQERSNDRGPAWWLKTREKLRRKLAAEDLALLDAELGFQRAHRHDQLPRGVIHADLFRDNALFDDDRLGGIIDLYYACNDVLLYDVAVTVNDWCSRVDGSLDPLRARAFLQAYHAERPFSAAEGEAWPVMLRAAALRFWLSRLQDLHFPREGEMTHIKDPQEFRRILEQRIAGNELTWIEAA